MKILANEVIQTIKDASFPTETFKVGKATLKKSDGSGINPALDFLKGHLNQEPTVGEALINVNKDVVVKLQINIINLPLLYPAAIEKATQMEQEYELNVYAIIEADKINSSHLRIDQIGTVDDLMADNPDLKANFADWMMEQFNRLDHPDQAQEEAE